jgi:hypothetical protein
VQDSGEIVAGGDIPDSRQCAKGNAPRHRFFLIQISRQSSRNITGLQLTQTGNKPLRVIRMEIAESGGEPQSETIAEPS